MRQVPVIIIPFALALMMASPANVQLDSQEMDSNVLVIIIHHYNYMQIILLNFSLDIDECTITKKNTVIPCHANGVCQNTVGGFSCTCISGYIGDGQMVCLSNGTLQATKSDNNTLP